MTPHPALPAVPDAQRESAVHCDTCEAVCCRLTVVLTAEDAVPAWLTEYDERGLHTMSKDEDGRCQAVDPRTRLCTIYDRRPQICRKFAMGGPYCRDEREAWFGKHPAIIPIVLC